MPHELFSLHAQKASLGSLLHDEDWFLNFPFCLARSCSASGSAAQQTCSSLMSDDEAELAELRAARAATGPTSSSLVSPLNTLPYP